ncbi:hypothetical protein E4U43_000848 [Claviceps pusilla]|uniref:Mediator of RNA polymerase II transcription subunit 12 n=1 Tax=Claviceps pusilla TaxID=123648 RepID=A0A9P7NGA1_9HYPO|nr:hypothetical protein E4U43_000848 [Claviceps pusilla]
MTSRTPMSVQPPRQPQRGLAPTLQVQRPSNHHQQRTISSSSSSSSQQQYFPTSPSKRDPVSASDANIDSSADPLSTRHASTSTPTRRQGSKLRLELSNDLAAGTGPLSATESPQLLTPSRIMPASSSEPVDADNMSPALSRASQHDALDNLPMPMPRRRLQKLSQTLSSTRPAVPVPTTPQVRKDVRPKPYTVEVPAAAPRYANTNRHDTATPTRDPFSKGLFSGHADFFPWSGVHHEDEWSTEAIQKGTWDRGTRDEASPARLVIFPPLKQKCGLNALSTIFMGVLNQRRHRGQITAPSTFKPPPRVTLTDTKREIWLKDLANPAISLRRLSRTIPHGIRGRTLLDQCLNKNVPTERAVWLAKCVGANEIRAFKRKGASGAFVLGGELKWIRDWTVFVEQFLEAVVSAFGEPDWKSKVTYAIRLATYLYAEQLLDRDHYLEWIVSGLENSPQSRIPMWLLIAQIHWSHLLQLRKCGRRLVFSILNHLHAIDKDPDRDVLIQLSGQLSALALSLVKENPESFICPPAWQRFSETLRLNIPADDTVAQEAYNNIKLRNARLSAVNTISTTGGSQRLVQRLDATLQGKFTPDLATECWESAEDKFGIIRDTVEWAISLHRPGIAKLYVAAGLIQAWSVFRVNATSAILDVLGDIRPGDNGRKKSMIRLVSELVRSGHFHVPQYVQWLIGRGGLHNAHEIDPVDGPCASRLLVELPVHCLPPELTAQRGSLLRRAGNYSLLDEENDTANAIECVDNSLGLATYLGNVDSSRKPLSQKKLLRRVVQSSRAVQSAIGAHLCDAVTTRLPCHPGFVMRLDTFMSIRTMMETIEDFTKLADILRSSSACPDADILAACVDTINANLDCFMAMGSAEALFDVFVARLKSISRDQGTPARPLLAALSAIAPRLPGRDDLAKQLALELAQNDRSNALDACSPVSDSMAAAAQAQAQTQTQTAEGEVSEQIDKLLASGNTIDHPTMNRLFRYIAPKLEAGWVKLDDNRRIFATLLSRLRMLDAPHFDKLMADWISHIRTLKKRPSLPELFPLLVSLGCLSMATILHTANASSVMVDGANEATVPKSATYLQELLQLTTMKIPSAMPTLEAEEAYRFRIQQQSAMFNHAKALALLIRNTIIEYSAIHHHHQAPSAGMGLKQLPLDNTECHDSLLETMRWLVVADAAMVAEVLNVSTLPAAARSVAQKIITRLLLPQSAGEASDYHQPSFDEILRLANDLTMPFCQLQLNLDLSTQQLSGPSHGGGSGGGSGEGGPQRFEAFAKAMDKAIQSQNMMWTSMLPCLSEDVTQGFNREAQTRFLDLMPSGKLSSSSSEPTANDPTDRSRIHLAENLLGVIEAINSGRSSTPSSRTSSFSLTNYSVDKLSDLWEMIASQDEDGPAQAKRRQVFDHWLPILLRFITLNSMYETANNSSGGGGGGSSSGSTAAATTNTTTTTTTTAATGLSTATTKPFQTAANHEAKARIIIVLCGLLLEIESLPHDPAETSLCQQIFDIAILLVDSLPDDLRTQCAKAILFLPGSSASTSTTSDARLYYLLSTPRPTSAENLRLVHRDKSALPHTAAARGMGALYGIGPASGERLSPFVIRRWEILSEPTPNVGENDTSLSLGLFEAIKIQ